MIGKSGSGKGLKAESNDLFTLMQQVIRDYY